LRPHLKPYCIPMYAHYYLPLRREESISISARPQINISQMSCCWWHCCCHCCLAVRAYNCLPSLSSSSWWFCCNSVLGSSCTYNSSCCRWMLDAGYCVVLLLPLDAACCCCCCCCCSCACRPALGSFTTAKPFELMPPSRVRRVEPRQTS